MADEQDAPQSQETQLDFTHTPAVLVHRIAWAPQGPNHVSFVLLEAFADSRKPDAEITNFPRGRFIMSRQSCIDAFTFLIASLADEAARESTDGSNDQTGES